jgi:hypothetical protein
MVKTTEDTVTDTKNISTEAQRLEQELTSKKATNSTLNTQKTESLKKQNRLLRDHLQSQELEIMALLGDLEEMNGEDEK